MKSVLGGSRRKRASWLKVLLLATVTVGCGIWLMGAADAVYDDLDTVDGVHLPEVQAIVCLAGGRGRISAAGDLWYRYWERGGKGRVPVLYFSGLGARSDWSTIQRQLRPGVREVLTPDQVILETQSINTEDNAQWLLQYILEKQWNSVLLVTSRYHMRRARLIVERLAGASSQERGGATFRLETLSVYQEPFEPGEWTESLQGIQVTFTEFFKWLYYRHLWTPTVRSPLSEGGSQGRANWMSRARAIAISSFKAKAR